MTIPSDCEQIFAEIINQNVSDIKHTDGKIYVKLKKALYGLKQSSKLWYDVLKCDLLSQRFINTTSDPCLFMKKVENNFCLVLVYVDDIIITSTDIQMINNLQIFMESKYGKISFQQGNRLSFLG